MNYKLVVDSSCELPEEITSFIETESIPFSMSLGADVYEDTPDLDVDAFIEKMCNYEGAAKSACPSPSVFSDAYEGDKDVFAITISANLSGAYSSAVSAVEIKETKNNVHVFNSKSASAGEILIAVKIKEAIEQGLNRTQIIETVESFIKEMKTFFTLESIDNLVKNGRINKLVGKAATLLSLKPIMGSDKDGNIAYYSRARSMSAAVDKISELIGKHCSDTNGKTLVITHCQNEEQAKRLQKVVEKMYDFKNIIVRKTRGLSSMYANRGGIIVAF